MYTYVAVLVPANSGQAARFNRGVHPAVISTAMAAVIVVIVSIVLAIFLFRQRFILRREIIFNDGDTHKRGQHSERVVLIHTSRLARARLYFAQPAMVLQLFKKQLLQEALILNTSQLFLFRDV